MEYQKMINLSDNAPNKTTKFGTKNWVEINDDLRETYKSNSQIKFKTSMLKPSLCDYSDAYILVKGTATVRNKAIPPEQQIIPTKKVILKNCSPFTNCICEINNAQINNAKNMFSNVYLKFNRI